MNMPLHDLERDWQGSGVDAGGVAIDAGVAAFVLERAGPVGSCPGGGARITSPNGAKAAASISLARTLSPAFTSTVRRIRPYPLGDSWRSWPPNKQAFDWRLLSQPDLTC
jgi:hypothetical protein